jgi:hypothetical protein
LLIQVSRFKFQVLLYGFSFQIAVSSFALCFGYFAVKKSCPVFVFGVLGVMAVHSPFFISAFSSLFLTHVSGFKFQFLFCGFKFPFSVFSFQVSDFAFRFLLS